jgi:hypothetical protein
MATFVDIMDGIGVSVGRLLADLGPQAFRLGVWAVLISLVHELGHAIAAHPAGFRLTSFGVGYGPVVLRVPLGHQRVFTLGLAFLGGGACVAIPERGIGPRAAWFHAGGLLAQVVLGLVLALFPAGPTRDLGLELNLLILVYNLLPWRWASAASDGWWLLNRLGPGIVQERPLFSRKVAFQRLLAHELRQSSPLGTAWARLMLAEGHLQLGELGLAQEQLLALPDGDRLTPALDAQVALAWGELGRQQGELEAPARSWAELRRRRPEAPPVALEDRLALGVARAAIGKGDYEGCRTLLVNFAGVGGEVGTLATLVRLELALAEQDPAAVRGAAARLAWNLSGPQLDPLGGLRAVSAAARYLGDEQAEGLRFAVRRGWSWLIEGLNGEARNRLRTQEAAGWGALDAGSP